MDDPFTFGAICAANAVSDIYAMGGTPLTALAMLGFATCDFGTPVIRKLLKGAVEKLHEAGVCLIGGHSIEDNEFKFGFAVSGVIESNRILKASGARAGETLVLTKKLGTGILTSAAKKGKVTRQLLKEAVQSMLSLNKAAACAALSAGSNGATDVTGFGLLGHGLNMAQSSGVNLVIHSADVPLMRKVYELSASGSVPKGARNNLAFCSKRTTFSGSVTEGRKLALSDPQTSGGLLLSLSPAGMKKFEQSMKRVHAPYWIIGKVVKGRGRIIVE